MAYHTEGTIKNLSVQNGTFQIAPTKEFLVEKDGGKHLLLASKDKTDELQGEAYLYDLKTWFSVRSHKAVLAILALNKTKVLLEVGSVSMTKLACGKSAIVVSDVVVV